MNKILFIIYLFVSFSYSQKQENFKNKKTTEDYIKTIFCENPFSTKIKSGFELEIIKNRNIFYLEYIQGDYKHEIKCNGEILLKFDYNHEEIEIYSLTEKEQKECFFSSKFIKEFHIQNIQSNQFNNGNIITGELKKNNLKIELDIMHEFLKKEEKIILYNIGEEENHNWKSTQHKNKIIFYNKQEFKKKFKDVFIENKFNINLIKEKYNDWEIIDFR
jgi:hypothetical protein